MKYLLFLMMVQKWATAASDVLLGEQESNFEPLEGAPPSRRLAEKVPTSKQLSDDYLGVRVESDAAIISLGKKQDWNMIYSGDGAATVIGNLKVTGKLTAGSSGGGLLDGLRKELKSADKSLEATLTKTIGELKGKIDSLEGQVQRLSGCANKPCANGGVCKVTDDGFRCDCSKATGFVGPRCDEAADSSCKALYYSGKKSSGLYSLKSKDGKKFETYCDMKTQGGGWTLLGSFVNTDSSKSWSRDVCGDANGWTLLHSTWIPSFDSQMSDELRSRGQFITPSGTKIKYNQVYFECQGSEGVGVQRVVTLAKSESAAKPANSNPGPARLKELQYSHDTCGDGSSSYFRNGGWNEMHYFGPRGGGDRFITRKNQVHCCVNYGAVGGEKDNPRLGNFGRVWVRQGTGMPKESDLPSCGHASTLPDTLAQCSADEVAACESFPCLELGRHDAMGGKNLMYLNPDKKTARISRRYSASEWSFFGLIDKEAVWKYANEQTTTFGPAKLLTNTQANFLQRSLQTKLIKASDLMVQSDLTMRIMRDDSASPSYFTYLRLDNFKIERFQFKIGGTDHTRVEYSAKDSMLRCYASAAGGSHNKCDRDGNKLKDKGAVYAILIEVHCSPKKGASAHANQFNRNAYTFRGSHYRVGVRVKQPKGVIGMQGANFKYVNEKTKTVGPVTFFTDKQALWLAVNALGGVTAKASDGNPKIKSDLKFGVQRDDSGSPSTIRYMRTDTWAIENFQFKIGGTDHTRVEFADNKFKCVASAAGGSHDKCSRDGNTLKNKTPIPVIILKVFLSPKEGATAHANQFQRNAFTLSGTHYYADFQQTATCSCKGGSCSKGKSLVGDWKCPGFWLGETVKIPADPSKSQQDFSDKTVFDYVRTCIDDDGLVHNGNAAWVSDSTFGDAKKRTTADFKSLAFSSLRLKDLMLSDASGYVGFTDVVDRQSLRAKMASYWGCQTLPQVFPGSSRVFSNQAKFKSNAMLVFYGADSADHCALSRFGGTNSNSAAIAVGGGDTGLIGVGQWGAKYNHGMDSNLKIADASVCRTGKAGVKCVAKTWKGVRTIAPTKNSKGFSDKSDFTLLWGR